MTPALFIPRLHYHTTTQWAHGPVCIEGVTRTDREELGLRGEGTLEDHRRTLEETPGTRQEKVNRSHLKEEAVFSQVEKSPVGRESPVI